MKFILMSFVNTFYHFKCKSLSMITRNVDIAVALPRFPIYLSVKDTAMSAELAIYEFVT